MKKYVLVIAIFAGIYVNAESNPFDLKENLQKIDKDQDVLLSALKEISDKKEDTQFDEVATPKHEVTSKNNSTMNQSDSREELEEGIGLDDNVSLVNTDGRDDIQEKPMTSEVRKQTNIEKNAIDSAAKTKAAELAQKVEEERLQKIKEEQLKIEAEREKLAAQKREVERKEQEKIVAQKAAELRKAEQEKLEVVAYERKRIEKQKKTMQDKEVTVKNTIADDAIADINITREEMMAKKAADKEYLEAIAEMDTE